MSEHDPWPSDWSQPPQTPGHTNEWFNEPVPMPSSHEFQGRTVIRKTLLKLGGAVAAATLVGGGAGFLHGLNAESPEGLEHSSALSTEVLESGEPAPDDVRADIERAVQVDNCETKVMVDNVTDVYQKMFGDIELPSTADKLAEYSEVAIDSLEAAGKKLSFQELTTEQTAFVNEAYSTVYAGDYQEYRQVFSEYLKGLNIKLIDSWVQGEDVNDSISSSVVSTMKPMSQELLGQSGDAKAQIVQAMESLATMPREVLNAIKLEAILIGDIAGTTDGQVLAGQNIVMLDAKPDGKISPIAVANHSNTMDHEVAHLFEDALCGATLSNFVDDTGYIELNRDFEYGKVSVTALDAGESVDGTYTTLDNINVTTGDVVVSRAYGATNEEEDKATLLGETIFSRYAVGNLVSEQPTDVTILHEKAALLIARIEQKNPDVAAYFIKRIQAARVVDAIEQAQEPLRDKSFELLDTAAQQGDFNAADHPDYQKLQDSITEFEVSAERLRMAINTTRVSESGNK